MYLMICAINITSKNTATLKRIIKARPFMQKVILLLERSVEEQIYSVPEGGQSQSIKPLMFLLAMCIHGTHPNASLWNDLLGKFDFEDFTRVNISGDNLNESSKIYFNEWNNMAADMMQTLLYVHKCDIELKPKTKLFVLKYASSKPSEIPSTPSERLMTYIPFIRRYVVFCSAPNCSKSSDQDTVFQYCGNCKMSRYCSVICQKNHWLSGHKNDCLKPTCIEQSDVTPWCGLRFRMDRKCNLAPENHPENEIRCVRFLD